MSLPQQKYREMVFQMLYSLDIGQAKDDDLIDLLMKELNVTKKSARDALDRTREIFKNLPQIDPVIEETASEYAFDRIQTVERNVLRLGVFEMLYDDQIPPKVAIAEAIRIARKFGTPESSHFINAILDAIYKKSQPKE
jgi:N utilization substance protein B